MLNIYYVSQMLSLTVNDSIEIVNKSNSKSNVL